MQILFDVIGIALVYVCFLQFTTLPAILDRKPFNCVTCLSFWSVPAVFILQPYIPLVIHVVAVGGYAAYLATFLKRIITKI
jgi:hypothetical protein